MSFGAVRLMAGIYRDAAIDGMLITHEVGHTVVARLLGDPRATFLLYGRSCIGCNLYNSARFGPWANVAVSLGGVLFTVLLTVAAVVALGWGVGYTDLDAATSFASQATGWSHDVVAAIGFGAAALYTVGLVAATRSAWRRGRRRPGRSHRRA